MSKHTDLFEEYRRLCNVDDEYIEEYYPYGENSIKVRFKDGKEVIWTLKGPENWEIESFEHYCRRIGEIRNR